MSALMTSSSKSLPPRWARSFTTPFEAIAAPPEPLGVAAAFRLQDLHRGDEAADRPQEALAHPVDRRRGDERRRKLQRHGRDELEILGRQRVVHLARVKVKEALDPLAHQDRHADDRLDLLE